MYISVPCLFASGEANLSERLFFRCSILGSSLFLVFMLSDVLSLTGAMSS